MRRMVPRRRNIRFGIIALTDCSSIVMAHELGLFKKHGIESIISKEASWAAIRDKLTLGENQATHMLFGMPFSSSMGLLGSPVKPMIIPFVLNRNGQAITLENDLKAKGIRTPQALKPIVDEAKKAGKPMTFAMTFPPGTHAMWTRYWLAAGGINPDKDVTLITIPPPQMVANMKVDKMDGFCVGEPWNARAIADGIGYTAVTTQQIWKDHPEKVLAFTRRVRRQESKNRQGDSPSRDRVEPVYRQAGKSPPHGRSGFKAAVHQHAERSHSWAACSAITITATAARKKIRTI